MATKSGMNLDRMTCCHKRFAWTPIIVGALVGLGISFLLNLFGMGIGISAFAADTAGGAKTLAWGGLIGLLIGTIVAMGLMGLIAGYLGGLRSLHDRDVDENFCNYGCLYGFTAWCLALVVAIMLSASIGNFIAYSTAALTNPTVSVEKIDWKTQTMVTNTKDAEKNLATASFVAFVLFFVGAVSASWGGHIGFDRSVRKHRM